MITPAVKLDVLPAGCGVAMEVAPGLSGQRFRFQAADSLGNLSEWSGWFTYEGEPIMLCWDAFWVTP